jgi:Protein of unknown function (DUF2971)
MFSPEQDRWLRILHPSAFERFSQIISKRTRFVHYTSAEAALNILKSREIWMRKSTCMNDFLEVRYGIDLLSRVYRNEIGTKFKSILNSVFSGITSDIEQLFDGWRSAFLADTYITCLSEHLDSEDNYGRLSMWRAYGDSTGIAFVINNSAFFAPTSASGGLNAYSSPVAYLDQPGLEQEVGRITSNIEQESDFFRTEGREALKSRIFYMLRSAVLSTKHPGFAEEKEWRILYCPTAEPSAHLTKEVLVVKGVPQPVYKIPLVNISEAGLAAAIPQLLDRIIIGPSQYSLAQYEAFLEMLTQAGVSDPATKIRLSEIPIRR